MANQPGNAKHNDERVDEGTKRSKTWSNVLTPQNNEIELK